jgi:hypothetical protein
MWDCPKCERSFRNQNQRHRCEKTTADAQLRNQSDAVLRTYQKIIQSVDKLGDYTVSPIKDYIMLKNKSTFLTIKPRKTYLDISFFLATPSDEFPIFKSIRASRNRVRHAARFDKPSDVSSLVLKWIKQSYTLTNR